MRYGWSLSKDDWHMLPNTLVKGDSWRSVQFNIADKNSVPACSGIYIICTLPPERRRGGVSSPNDLFGLLYMAIYVGQSENLKQRFHQHCTDPKAEIQDSRECYEDSMEFWFTRVDVDQLDVIESQLIGCLGPPANAVKGVIFAKIQHPIPA